MEAKTFEVEMTAYADVFYLRDQEEPLTVDAIVEAIFDGTMTRETLVAPEMWFESPGESGWMKAGEIPAVRQRLRDGELRVVDGAYKSTPRATPRRSGAEPSGIDYGESVMMVSAGPPRIPREPKNG
jgi:hypothetical protein